MKINKFIKRLFDIIVSLILLTISFPVFLIIGFCIKIDTKGPIFFKQQRLTIYGNVFTIYKFRTMVANAEKLGPGLFNYKSDSRVTKVGKFLRKTSIDELPQLINICKGDMSLVGPRPCVVNELGDFNTLNKKYLKRFTVKAGLTGLAQVNGRNDIKWNEKIEYDNKYVELFNKYGIIFDIYIIVKTLFVFLKKETIYETKIYSTLSDEEAARLEQEEVIKNSHITTE